MPAELKTTRVDMTGLLDVLGKNLYSTPNVALRELVQNAHDSVVRRSLESDEPFETWITVTTGSSPARLIIEDSGAGLTERELDDYLATIGRGYTRELREKNEDAELIGMFGLGFLTAFIVSRRVDVFTTSHTEPDKTWHFSSSDGQRYVVEPAESRAVGTRVELTLGERFEHLADAAVVSMLLSRYAILLPAPIFTDAARRERINDLEPTWRMVEPPSPLRKKKLDLELAQRFEPTFAPICTYDVDAGGLKGVIWVQDGSTFATSDNRNVSAFIRGMMVSNDARDLLPKWAGFFGGVVESETLMPTASREELREDDAYLDAQIALHEAVIDGLSHTARHDAANWRRVVRRHNEALLGAAMSDDRLFDVIAKDLRVSTSAGELTIDAIARRTNKKIYVSFSEGGSYEETLFRALMMPVVNGARYAAHPFARRYAAMKGYEVIELGTPEGNAALFGPPEVDAETADALKAAFDVEEAKGMELVLASFRPPELPLVVMPDREAELKARIESDDADKRIGSAALGLARMFTDRIGDRAPAKLYVNTAAPVIRALLASSTDRRAIAARMLVSVAQMTASRGEEAALTDVTKLHEAFSASVVMLLNGDDE